MKEDKNLDDIIQSYLGLSSLLDDISEEIDSKTNLKKEVLESAIEDISDIVKDVKTEIKTLSSEEIKLYRVHKEGELVGLIKAKKILEDRIKRLEI